MQSIPFRHRLLFQVGSLLLMMAALSLLILFTSYIILENTDEDAQAINLSGSLRMLSFQSLALLPLAPQSESQRQALEEKLSLIDERLNHGLIPREVDAASSEELTQHYNHVQGLWRERIQPRLNSLPPAEAYAGLKAEIEQFVQELDQLVSLFEQQAERHIYQLRLVQVIALFATLTLVGLSFLFLNRRVEIPLRQLTETAVAFSNREFDKRAETRSGDELALLGSTMNNMATTLSELYRDLESKVATKTRALKVSADSLNFLYQFSEACHRDRDEQLEIGPWVDELCRIISVSSIDVCLAQPRANLPYSQIRTDDSAPLPLKCERRSCEACLTSAEGVQDNHKATCQRDGAAEDSLLEDPVYATQYSLYMGGDHFGVLSVRHDQSVDLEDWKKQLVRSFCDQLARLLEARQQRDQKERLALFRERSVIARELHDSIAQALSYLKIQVTRQKRLISQNPIDEQKLTEINEELQLGLSTAYSQLRELLTTFRLPATGEGFAAALQQTIEQLQEQQRTLHFELHNHCEHIPLGPEEGIHLLQLIREALQNACKHSQGTRIQVHLDQQGDEVEIRVSDDGVGICENPAKMNHYGLAIMQERARNLEGELSLEDTPGGGATVRFHFHPRELVNTRVSPVSNQGL